jgi:hypothetical protein
VWWSLAEDPWLVNKKIDSEGKIQQIYVCIYLKYRYNLADRVQIQPISRAMATACKHPKVRIVSRHEDAEFVECLECGEVFDSDEFRDMEIEESADTEEAASDL